MNNPIIDIPKPEKNKSYFDLSKFGTSGLLSVREKYVRTRWIKRYVVIYNGCLYKFKNENDKTYSKAYPLFGYNQVCKAPEVPKKDAAFPFKIIYGLNKKEQMKYFDGKTERDRMEWMKALREEMEKIHRLDCWDKESVTDSGIDTECPISTMEFMENLRDNHSTYNDEDSDLESNYSYVSFEAGTSDLPKPPTVVNPIFSKNLSAISTSQPITPRVRSPGRPLPKPPSSLQNSETKSSKHPPPLPPQSSKSPPQHSISIKSQRSPVPQLPTPPVKTQQLQQHEHNRSQQNPYLQPAPTRLPPIIKEKPDLEQNARWEGDPDEGQRWIAKYGREGSYMIRKSIDGSDVLLVIYSFRPRKYKIFNKEGKVCLKPDGERFDRIQNLILYYRNNCLPNRDVKLIKPYTALETWMSEHSQNNN